MNIRVLNEVDALLYQELRLNALKTDPGAFASTYEREVQFSIETVIDRVKPLKDKFVLGAFNQKGSLCGMVTFVREANEKMAHKGNVFGMYVDVVVRRQGIGKSLLLELIKTVKKCEGVEQIHLAVVSNHQPAKKLYESIGFEVYGTERNAIKFNGQYYDEDLMVYFI